MICSRTWSGCCWQSIPCARRVCGCAAFFEANGDGTIRGLLQQDVRVYHLKCSLAYRLLTQRDQRSTYFVDLDDSSFVGKSCQANDATRCVARYFFLPSVPVVVAFANFFFGRIAATDAGLCTAQAQLIFALEPEAASVACRDVRICSAIACSCSCVCFNGFCLCARFGLDSLPIYSCAYVYI